MGQNDGVVAQVLLQVVLCLNCKNSLVLLTKRNLNVEVRIHTFELQKFETLLEVPFMIKLVIIIAKALGVDVEFEGE